MNETPPPAMNLSLHPYKKYVLEKAMQLATANGIHLKDAASQVLDAIALLNSHSQATATDALR